MSEIFGLRLDYVIIGILGFVLILLIWITLLSLKFNNLTVRYNRLLRGSTSVTLEERINSNMSTLESSVEKVEHLEKELSQLSEQVQNCLQRLEIVRYNAFSDTGSDLSYSIALMNEKEDGLILTGIYGRNESYTYAKPIVKGQSAYALSGEEETVLRNAKKK